MPIRNPFVRRAGAPGPNDENVRPGSSSADTAYRGFERVDTVGSKSLNVGPRRSQDTGEYKMSVVNDSGVYLPPSPPEKDVSWPKRYRSSRTSTDTGADVGEIEHFSISRESFDSYRRSFDISARSPVVASDPAPRQSLDSTRFTRHYPRSGLVERRYGPSSTTAVEEFEDVGLGDDGRQHNQVLHQQPKKRSFLSKFTTTDSGDSSHAAQHQHQQHQQPTSMARFLTGRKRGQSGQGSELGAMPIPDAAKSAVSVIEAKKVNTATS